MLIATIAMLICMSGSIPYRFRKRTLIFAFTGGVYRTMLYDNMRVAVARFVGKYEKEPTQALLQLRGHYGFSHRFCNAYQGNERGMLSGVWNISAVNHLV